MIFTSGRHSTESVWKFRRASHVTWLTIQNLSAWHRSLQWRLVMPKRFVTGLDSSDRQGTDAPDREEWAIAVIWLAVYVVALGSPMVSKAIEFADRERQLLAHSEHRARCLATRLWWCRFWGRSGHQLLRPSCS